MPKMSKKIKIDNSNFPTFQNPKIVGSYSLMGRSLKYLGNALNILYLMLPEDTKIDLNVGFYELLVRRMKDRNEINPLIRWIDENPLNVQKDVLIACLGDVLTKIMITPYHPETEWIICARKFENVIYLQYFPPGLKNSEQNTKKEKKIKYGRLRFKQMLMAECPNEPPQVHKLTPQDEFYLVYRSCLNDHNLLYASKVAGADACNFPLMPTCTAAELNDTKFIQVKTIKSLPDNQKNLVRNKFIKWWSETSLIDMDEIIVGYQDDNCVVNQIYRFKTKDLPKMNDESWHPSVCMNFLDDFLTYMKPIVCDVPELTVIKFEQVIGKGISYTKLDSPAEYDFLPSWFIEGAE